MKIISKLGGIKEVYEILKNFGWTKNFHALYMQIKRKQLSKEVILILLAFARQKNLNIDPEDFYSNKGGVND